MAKKPTTRQLLQAAILQSFNRLTPELEAKKKEAKEKQQAFCVRRALAEHPAVQACVPRKYRSRGWTVEEVSMHSDEGSFVEYAKEEGEAELRATVHLPHRGTGFWRGVRTEVYTQLDALRDAVREHCRALEHIQRCRLSPTPLATMARMLEASDPGRESWDPAAVRTAVKDYLKKMWVQENATC